MRGVVSRASSRSIKVEGSLARGYSTRCATTPRANSRLLRTRASRTQACSARLSPVGPSRPTAASFRQQHQRTVLGTPLRQAVFLAPFAVGTLCTPRVAPSPSPIPSTSPAPEPKMVRLMILTLYLSRLSLPCEQAFAEVPAAVQNRKVHPQQRSLGRYRLLPTARLL